MKVYKGENDVESYYRPRYEETRYIREEHGVLQRKTRNQVITCRESRRQRLNESTLSIDTDLTSERIYRVTAKDSLSHSYMVILGW